jgi:hypothetical protein
MKEAIMKGTCLCGAVSIVAPDNTHMSACHCGMCRRWGGGPVLAVHSESGVEISGAESITAFRSSDWAERAFCSRCGTHLYYRLIPGDEYALSVGLFQDGIEFELREQIFVDRKPDSYEFANDTENLTEAEVMRGIKVWAEAHMDEVQEHRTRFDSEPAEPTAVTG